MSNNYQLTNEFGPNLFFPGSVLLPYKSFEISFNLTFPASVNCYLVRGYVKKLTLPMKNWLSVIFDKWLVKVITTWIRRWLFFSSLSFKYFRLREVIQRRKIASAFNVLTRKKKKKLIQPFQFPNTTWFC